MAIDRVLDVIRQLASLGKTICIIEHNLDVVKLSPSSPISWPMAG